MTSFNCCLEMTPSSKLEPSTWSTIVRTKIRKSTWSRQEMILPREILREIRVEFVWWWFGSSCTNLEYLGETKIDWLTNFQRWYLRFGYGDTIIQWLLFTSLSLIFIIFPKVIRSYKIQFSHLKSKIKPKMMAFVGSTAREHLKAWILEMLNRRW